MDKMLAFDRSVREYDVDGRLRVASAHITREQVAPYLTEEIPGWENLGLEPGRVYNLYRSAAEIQKGAQTAAGLPLLRRHVPVSANDHKPEDVVGALGTEITFNAPYLDAPLIVWAADSIDSIEDGTQKELSCGYYYTPVLQNGVFEGQEYQLLMTNLIFNHCALVEAGRAGPTVVVGDSALPITIQTESMDMKQTKPSMTAMLARGALLVSVVPKLATDQKIDATKLTAGLTAKNLGAKLPGILGAIKPKLAQDSDFAAIQLAFDAVEEEAKKMEAEDDFPEMKPKGAEDEEDDEEEKKKKEKAAMDAEEDEAKKKAEEMKDKKEEKAAMDAAIKTAMADAVKQATDAARKEARETREAEAFARTFVGEIAIACDSAEQVYKAALDILKVDLKDVPPVAYKHILAAQPKPNERKHVIAQDSAVMAADRDSFAKRFPKSRAAAH